MNQSSRRARHRPAVLLGGVVLALSVVDSRPAGAGWPLPSTATAEDARDPANWPNDPEYAFHTDPVAKNRASGLWQYYSFVPDRSPGAPPLRPGETASGMSVDLAWRHTTGRDDVVIAVVDSGILWDSADLLDEAYLNVGELAAHRPTRADGTACGGSDSLAGFDCNGDGRVSISDYADTVWLRPEAADGRPKGDANGNGMLDAGDLITMKSDFGTPIVSDGIDDDGNGYVDDISGWDFFKDDNDPYDDTRYGHGTGEANDSTGAGNNGVGGIGACPQCRFLPLRAGDSFIVDVQDYAQAVVYATDNGASVIQEALGTLNMTSFAQASMDYAWSNGVVVIASMADENARHPNVPAAANHTLPVHAITMHGRDSTVAQSFLHFNTCTNFGAQNFLSASGTGCSSEAVGRLSGISGLVYSAGRDLALTPPLSASEVMQILLTTADDIHVPESEAADSPYFFSQPGFDQRFGYGRVNANRAVEAVLDRRIPPRVDVVRPYWFEVLYADRVTGPVPILGTISAPRASSFDYVVEWAPGVEPLDAAFATITKDENVPGSEVIGAGGGPLAELDVRGLDVSHERDPDSPHGENDFTITVRVRATAHYGGDVGDVPGELRRAYYVHEDPDLVDGFPVYLGASGEASPKLADIDGDGVRDVVIATANGVVDVLTLASGEPEHVAGFPFRAKRLDGLDGAGGRADYRSAPGYAGADGVGVEAARESFVAAPSVADLDGDGRLDIVVTSYEGTIFGIGSDGTALDGFPIRLPDVPSCPLDRDHSDELCMGIDRGGEGSSDDIYKTVARGAYGSPVLEDMDGDGRLEIVQAAFDGRVHVFKADGSRLDGWPVRITDPLRRGQGPNRIFTTPAVGDFNGDGIPDVLVGSNEALGGGTSGAVYLVDGRGLKAPGVTKDEDTYFPNWPVTMVSVNPFPLISQGVPNSPVAADFDGDGVPEAVMHGNASSPVIVPTDPGFVEDLSVDPPNRLPNPRLDYAGEVVLDNKDQPARGIESTSIFGPESKAQLPDTMFPLFAQPAVGDLDQDGTPDVTASGLSLSVALNLLAQGVKGGIAQHMLSMWSGRTGQMMPASPIVIEDFTFFNNQAIADLTGDGYPEVITGSGGYYVHAVDLCGREPEGWPKFTGQWIIATTAVGDIDGDDQLEVVVPTRSGWLYAWHTAGKSDGTIAWESFHHDNRNTGNTAVELEQGTPLGASQPLEIDRKGHCVIPGVVAPDGGPGRRVLAPRGGCGCRVAGSRTPDPGSVVWLLLPALVVARCGRSSGRRRGPRGGPRQRFWPFSRGLCPPSLRRRRLEPAAGDPGSVPFASARQK